MILLILLSYNRIIYFSSLLTLHFYPPHHELLLSPIKLSCIIYNLLSTTGIHVLFCDDSPQSISAKSGTKKAYPCFTHIRGTPMPELHAKTRIRHHRDASCKPTEFWNFWRFLMSPSLEDTEIFRYSIVQMPKYRIFCTFLLFQWLRRAKYTPRIRHLQIRLPRPPEAEHRRVYNQ